MPKVVSDPNLLEAALDLVHRSPSLPLVDVAHPLGAPPVFIQHIDALLTDAHARGVLLLPNLQKAQAVGVFSDYGGEHKGSRHHTYSMVIAAIDALGLYFEQMANVRATHGLGRREMAFKKLNDRVRCAALPAYLGASDGVLGLLFTLVVSKDLGRELVDPDPGRVDAALAHTGLNLWKRDVQEKALRIAHLGAYLTALLARDGQKLLWMSDNDQAIDSRTRHHAAAGIFQAMLGYYRPRWTPPFFGIATPFEADDGTHDLRDLLSIADLAAGATGKLVTAHTHRAEEEVADTTRTIVRWMSYQGFGLKRVMVRMSRGDDGSLQATFVTLQPDPPFDDDTIVPIVL